MHLILAKTDSPDGYRQEYCLSCLTVHNFPLLIEGLTVIQKGDCVNTILQAGDARDQYSITYSQSDDYTFKADYYFDLADPDLCPIESCRIHDENCDQEYEGDEVSIKQLEQGGDTQFIVKLVRDISQGYSIQFCLRCTTPGDNANSVAIAVEQSADCRVVVQLRQDAKISYEYSYSESDSLLRVFDAVQLFDSEPPCGITSCEVRDPTCANAHPNKILIDSQFPFAVSVEQN